MRRFLLGTDWWDDCDDVLAVRLFARAHRRGDIQLAGVWIDACGENSAASLDAFLTAEGLPGLPLGLDRAATDFGGRSAYHPRLAKLPHSRENPDLPDAAGLLISALRASPEPVELAEVGYPQVLAEACAHEPALFSEKVSCIWMMAGKWDENPGRENNFARAPRSRRAASELLASFPGNMIFLGFECGVDVITGGTPECPGDLAAQAFADQGCPSGRCSWDPMLAALAITGDPAAAGYTLCRGTAVVDAETGLNSFSESGNGRHAYVLRAHPAEFYVNQINSML